MELLNADGYVVKTYRYDAFGNIIAETGPTINAGFTYTGRELHPRSGLYYYRARWYDPELGRFLTPDPIGYLGGVNLYAYVGNDPVNRVDPLGLYSRAERFVLVHANRIQMIGIGAGAVLAPVAGIPAIVTGLGTTATIAEGSSAAAAISYLMYIGAAGAGDIMQGSGEAPPMYDSYFPWEDSYVIRYGIPSPYNIPYQELKRFFVPEPGNPCQQSDHL